MNCWLCQPHATTPRNKDRFLGTPVKRGANELCAYGAFDVLYLCAYGAFAYFDILYMRTNSCWILPVTQALLGAVSMLISLRTPNSDK